MEAKVQSTGKKALKIAGAACFATGVVAVSAVVASGAAVGAVVEGFKTAKNTMKHILKDETVDADMEEKAVEAEPAEIKEEYAAEETGERGTLTEEAAEKVGTE